MYTGDNTVHFPLQRWHLLTETPAPGQGQAARQGRSTAFQTDQPRTDGAGRVHPHLAAVSPALTRLLYDVLVYPYSSVSVRIKRLSVSARAFEQAKLEGCEKGFIFESAAGATTYLIPLAKTFEAFHFPYPYERAASVEHSFYVGWGRFLLEKDPSIKAVHTELKLGNSNCTSDVVTIAHDGTRRAYEVTLSTTNLLSNAAKYARTDFVQIIFLCRDYKLREAAKACCREGGLDADLLARLEFQQFSTLLNSTQQAAQFTSDPQPVRKPGSAGLDMVFCSP